MPKRKTKKINIRDLKCFDTICKELSEYPEYKGYMLGEGVLHIKEYVPPTINDVDKVIANIRFSHATKKYKYEVLPNGKELIDQQTLAKMAGVSRQTIARWESLHFISRSYVGLSDDLFFQIKEVISQLEKLKSGK